MPIDYSEYHPKWTLISRLIRFYRANNKCEWCGVPNYQLIYRYANGRKWDYFPEDHQGDALLLDGFKPVKIILTTAHLDHNKNNNRFWNLAALCQKCHLNHDRHRHVAKRLYGYGVGQLKLKL